MLISIFETYFFKPKKKRNLKLVRRIRLSIIEQAQILEDHADTHESEYTLEEAKARHNRLHNVR